MPTARIVVNPEMGKRTGSTLKIALGAIVLFFAASACWHIVPPGNRGIAVTLGKVAAQPFGEGINFKLPIVTRVIDMPIKQIMVEGSTDVFSSDLQNIRVTYAVMYRIPENKVVTLYQNYYGDVYQTLVEPRMRESLKLYTATMRAEDLAKQRDKLKVEVVKKLQEQIGDLIQIADVNITNLELSKQLEAAIEQKVIREQESLAKKFELEKAEKDAEILLVNAKAEAESVKVRGEALKQSPEVIQLEIARKWNGQSPQSVVVGSGGANVLLPLSK